MEFGIVWKLIIISKQRHLKPNLIDSMITLAWIKGYPNHWKTFVANHVSQWILEVIGATPRKILLIFYRGECDRLPYKSIWWDDRDEWPRTQSVPVPEKLPSQFVNVTTQRDLEFVAFYKYLNYAHLARVILPKILSSDSCTTSWSTILQIAKSHSSYSLNRSEVTVTRI